MRAANESYALKMNIIVILRSVAPPCEEVIFHLKEAIVHLRSENQCWVRQFLVASEI